MKKHSFCSNTWKMLSAGTQNSRTSGGGIPYPCGAESVNSFPPPFVRLFGVFAKSICWVFAKNILRAFAKM